MNDRELVDQYKEAREAFREAMTKPLAPKLEPSNFSKMVEAWNNSDEGKFERIQREREIRLNEQEKELLERLRRKRESDLKKIKDTLVETSEIEKARSLTNTISEYARMRAKLLKDVNTRIDFQPLSIPDFPKDNSIKALYKDEAEELVNEYPDPYDGGPFYDDYNYVEEDDYNDGEDEENDPFADSETPVYYTKNYYSVYNVADWKDIINNLLNNEEIRRYVEEKLGTPQKDKTPVQNTELIDRIDL